MFDQFKLWVSDPFLAGLITLIGTAFGIVGVIAAVYSYFKTRQEKFIKFAARGYFLAGEKNNELPSEISIYYKGIPVERITKTIFHIWNGGNVTINGSCLSNVDKLKIKLMDVEAEILSAEIIFKTRNSVQPSLMISPNARNEIEINFDFLDKGDGISVELLHSGKKLDVDCLGTIKGQTKTSKRINYSIINKKEINIFGKKIKTDVFKILTGLFYILLAVAMYVQRVIKEGSWFIKSEVVFAVFVTILMGALLIFMACYNGGLPRAFLKVDSER